MLCTVDYKGAEALKSCLSEFHRILWYDPLYSPVLGEDAGLSFLKHAFYYFRIVEKKGL